MRLLRGLAALVVLAVLLVGLPAGLIAVGTLDGLPEPDHLWDALTRPDDGSLLLAVLTLVGWVGWGSFALSVIVEVPAQIRSVPAPRLPRGLTLPQSGARVLVGAVIGMFAVVSSPGGADAASEVVQPGDTLSSIAQTHLGEARLWPQIAEANPDAIDDPDLIHPGQVLDIPEPETRTTQAPGKRESPEALPTDRGAETQSVSTNQVSIAPGGVTQAPMDVRPDATPVPDRTDTPAPPREAGHPAEDTGASAGTAGIGVGACTAAGVLALLAARRAAQSRHRRAGHRIALPTGPAAAIEESLHETSDTSALSHLDRAMRTIAEWANRTGTPMPALRGALIATDEIELYLVDESVDLPAPFTPAEDQATWVLARSTVRQLLPEDQARDIPAPYPSLVTIGHDEDGAWVLLNLEEIGALNITGPPSTCRDALAAMTLELAGTGWADDLRVTLVGALPDLAETISTDRVEHVTSLSEVIPGLVYASDIHTRTLDSEKQPSVTAARAARVAEETWTPHLILLGSDPSEEEREVLETLMARTPRMAVAAITTATEPLSPWVLDVHDHRARLEPAGIDLTPQTVTRSDYESLIALFDVTDDADTAGPVWTSTLGDEPSLIEIAATPGATDQSEVPVPEPTHGTGAGDECGGSRMRENSPDEDGLTPVQDLRHPGPIVRLLGSVQIQQAPGKRPRSPGRATELIAFLALHPADDHGPLDAAMWPSQDVDAKRRNPLVTQARKWLGDTDDGQPRLTYADDGGYRLHKDVRVDWHELTRTLADDISVVDTRDLVAALRMVDGQPVSGVSPPYYRWAEADRQEMIQTVADVAHEVSGRALSAGDPRTAAWAAAKGIEVAPESELLWRAQLRAAWLSAAPGRVQQVADQMVTTLEPLGGDLEPETTELLDQLLSETGPVRAHA